MIFELGEIVRAAVLEPWRDRAVVPVDVVHGLGIEVVMLGQGAGLELVLRQLPGEVVHGVVRDHAEERVLRLVGTLALAHEVERAVGELDGQVLLAVHLAAVLVQRADPVRAGGLTVVPGRLAGVVEVVQAAHAEPGQAVKTLVEAVVLGARPVPRALGPVVDLPEVAGAIPGAPQHLGNDLPGSGREGGGVEPAGAPALLVGAGDEARPGGGADRRGDIALVEDRPLGREAVQMRGAGVGAAAGGAVGVPVIVRDDQQDVRSIRGRGGHGGVSSCGGGRAQRSEGPHGSWVLIRGLFGVQRRVTH